MGEFGMVEILFHRWGRLYGNEIAPFDTKSPRGDFVSNVGDFVSIKSLPSEILFRKGETIA